MKSKVLLLAGTTEARDIARGLAALPDINGMASLAGKTRHPIDLGIPTRHGGFGGDAGFAEFLTEQKIDAVIDATHPFAHLVSARSARICREKDVPYLQVLRAAWTPTPQDHWVSVECEEDVAGILPMSARVFLATGPTRLHRFANLADRHVFCRHIDASSVSFPLTNGAFVQGRPPFTVAEEKALLRKLRVDWLVTKNAGGSGGLAKLVAARQLGLPVAMIARPAMAQTPFVTTAAQALKWIENA